MTKAELRIETLAWARRAMRGEAYLYHVAKGDEVVDRIIHMVVKSAMALPGEDSAEVPALLMAEYDKWLSMHWMTIRRTIIEAEMIQRWSTPQLIYRLHRMDNGAPYDLKDESTLSIHDHSGITDYMVDTAIFGG